MEISVARMLKAQFEDEIKAFVAEKLDAFQKRTGLRVEGVGVELVDVSHLTANPAGYSLVREVNFWVQL